MTNRRDNILIKQLDNLAIEFESRGELTYASVLDEITNLLLTADQDIPSDVSNLADVLRAHLPIPPEEALSVAKELFSKYSVGGDEVEGEIGFITNYFPAGGLPHKERRHGPRLEDVQPGKAEWWKSS